LVRTTIQRLGDAIRSLVIGPQYKRLARFSADMRTCLHSAIDVARALELCLKPLANTALGQSWSSAAGRVREGSSLADALRPGDQITPAFYLPVVEAGESSGRLVEAFDFLERHCNLLAAPAAAIRGAWLYPICILLAGSVLRILIHLMMGSVLEGGGLFVTELASWLQLAIIVAVVALTPLRQLFDQLRLSIPWLGELEREIAIHRFFRVMALMYETGDGRVEEMIRTAAKTVTNHAAQSQLLGAAEAIERGATISEAFIGVTLLTTDERGTIDAGELSGTLESALNRIADESESSMMSRLAFLQPILNRIVMAFVAFSIVSTMAGLVLR
jgi:type II secretory pathway component PulF